MEKLEALFYPLRIRDMALDNRLVMPPMHTAFGTVEGTANSRLIEYYARRACGGVGLIIQEATSVAPEGRGGWQWLGIWDDASVAGWRDLVEAVHERGAKIAIQLHHAGGEASAQYTGRQPVAPSLWRYREEARVLTVPEIVDIEDAFASAAQRAMQAGYDAVELHGAHGYLLSEFLSPLSNLRDDEYGGDADRRLRLVLNVVAKVRLAVGPTCPISFRISADEFQPGGLTLGDSQAMAPKLVAAGVDILHVSAGRMSSLTVAPMEVAHGHLVYLAAGMKQAVNVPVIAVGRITDARMAEDILRSARADLVAMGRALIADPDLPNKAREGRFDDIRPCIGCHQGCRRERGRYQLGALTCLSNPSVGTRHELAEPAHIECKKVVVIGGGPGGLEAARVAALAGHHVTLFERGQALGGRLRAGAVAPGKGDVATLIRHLQVQVHSLGVDVRLGQTATREAVGDLDADEVIVATGAEPIVPQLRGVNREHVALAEDVLLSRVQVGQRVVVMGAGMTGCEVAEHLAASGRHVRIVTRIERQSDIAADLPLERRRMLLDRLKSLGVEIIMSTAVEVVLAGAVRVRNDSEERRLPADTVVLAQGYRTDDRLVEQMIGLGLRVQVIGDARQCRTAREAISEGAAAARRIGSEQHIRQEPLRRRSALRSAGGSGAGDLS